MQATIFAKTSILDVLLCSEYISDYLGVSSIITKWTCHFESSKNPSNLTSIIFKYLEQKFPLAIKLCSKSVRTSPWRTRTVLLRSSGFYIVNLEHVYNRVAVSISDNDLFDIYIYIYIYIHIYIYIYIYGNHGDNKLDIHLEQNSSAIAFFCCIRHLTTNVHCFTAIYKFAMKFNNLMIFIYTSNRIYITTIDVNW